MVTPDSAVVSWPTLASAWNDPASRFASTDYCLVLLSRGYSDLHETAAPIPSGTVPTAFRRGVQSISRMRLIAAVLEATQACATGVSTSVVTCCARYGICKQLS